MNSPAQAKLKMLQASTNCLACGLLGLVPVIGLPFALSALWFSGRARQQEKRFWNAARRYRLIGEACAACGAILWSCILIFVVFRLILQGLR
jgi:hypothetical protein